MASARQKSHTPAKSQDTKSAGGSVTPSMAQYLEIKAANPDSLLWYRMGDFYELFFEDAVVAADALSITLTKRGKHLGEDIPMCGVPVVRADEYLNKLIRQGFRVAVCEQLEDPAQARKRGSKAVVKRDVVRLVTPGTITEDALLEPKARNFLTALFRLPQDGASGQGLLSDATDIALASVDISTGEFEVGVIRGGDLPGELMRISPKELIGADGVVGDPEFCRWIEVAEAVATPVPSAYFDGIAGERALKDYLGVAELGGVGEFSRGELAAIGGVLKYVDLTQIGAKPLLQAPKRIGGMAAMVIDAATRASLELVRSSSGEKRGSLLNAIDRTVTGAGARELASRLSSPLGDPRAIAARLDAVAYLTERGSMRADVRAALRAAPDIARAMPRLSFQRGGPRDLAAIRDGLGAAQSCLALLQREDGGIGLPSLLEGIAEQLSEGGGELAALLMSALVDEPPPLKRDGGFVRPGYSVELDDAVKLKADGRKVVAELASRYVTETGIKGLKIRHNNILGYFIEAGQVSAKPLMEAPLNETFKHRQTMANALRFTTAELIETEGRIATAGERVSGLEHEVFADLCTQVLESERILSGVAAALAELDTIAALAELAEVQGYVRPVVDDSEAFEIHGGRHPVVEQALALAREGPFIENDCVLGRAAEAVKPPGFDEGPDARIWLVTGPNMAGKSTFLRQNALICVLAQMGSFVPARYAHIGLVDRLFSRVGASDDLARGRSTFMVEMVETAAILNQATARSLVILDEIGRGTATFDGLSIAWACVEYLHEMSKSRALFATHYHELTVLPERLEQIANVTMDVTEWHDEIVFLHKVKPGAADRSYGIQVAKLAGLPARVVERAGEVLRLLEAKDGKSDAAADLIDELPLFAAARPRNPAVELARTSQVEVELEQLQPDDLTPRQALEALYRLKAIKRETDSGGSSDPA